MTTSPSFLKARLLGLAIAAPLALAALPASAASYFVTELNVRVGVSVERIWTYLSDFCTFATRLNQPSTCTTGTGGVGSIRLLADGTQDLVVATGPYSYTYETIVGPLAAADYHFSLRVEEIDPLQSMIVVTLIWDEEAFPPAEREAMRISIRQTVEGEIQDAKLVAEGS